LKLRAQGTSPAHPIPYTNGWEQSQYNCGACKFQGSHEPITAVVEDAVLAEGACGVDSEPFDDAPRVEKMAAGE